MTSPYRIPGFPVPGIDHAVSTVADGNMSLHYGLADDVLEKRAAFLKTAGMDPGNCVLMSLEHGTTVTLVTDADQGRGMTEKEDAPETDALITNTPGLGLFLLTADCLPILLADSETHSIGLAHLSWKCTRDRLIEKVIGKMVSAFGTRPEHLTIGIGPGIRAASYHKTELSQADDPQWQPYLTPQADGATAIDLVRFNRDQLVGAGVRPEHIIDSGVDTAVSHDFFSHYRSAKRGEQEGRFATVLFIG